MNVLRRVGGGSNSNAQQQQSINGGSGDAAGLVDAKGQPLDKHCGLENVSVDSYTGLLASCFSLIADVDTVHGC
jgi:hypothetical protein